MNNFYKILNIFLLFFCTNFCAPEKQSSKKNTTTLTLKDISTFTDLAQKLTEGKAGLQDCKKLQKILDTASQQNCKLQEPSVKDSKLSALLTLAKQHSKKSTNP
jgi:hypothetical protein